MNVSQINYFIKIHYLLTFPIPGTSLVRKLESKCFGPDLEPQTSFKTSKQAGCQGKAQSLFKGTKTRAHFRGPKPELILETQN